MTDYPVFPPPPGERPRGPAPAPPQARPSAHGPGEGPAWEIAPSPASWLATAREVLVAPRLAFGRMRRTGGIGLAFGYVAIGLAVGMAGTAFWRIGTMSIRGGFALLGPAEMLGAILFGVVAAFVATCVALMVYTALVHGLLSLLGKARYGFDATFRTIAYAYGSAAPAGLIPCVGSTVGVVWAIVVAIPGLAETHETDTSMAALAVLTPALMCCGLVIGALFMAFGAALATRH